MAATIKDILHDALGLSAASRAQLVEKLNESIEADIDPALQQTHLNETRRRREQVSSGKAKTVPGDDVLQEGRDALKQ
jgi:putative addiction module component (TIGR02574 family)